MAHVTMTFKTTANRAEIVTTTDLKNFLRVDHSSDDSLIEALRDTAFRWIEDHCNTKLGDVQFDAYLDGFYPARLPVGQITAITHVKYKPHGWTSGALTDLPSGHYFFDLNSQMARVRWDNPPSVADDEFHTVQITGQVGYAENAVPQPLIQAARILVSHLYDNRTAVTIGATPREVPFTVLALCNPYRIQ